MEGKLSEALRHYSFSRSKLLETFKFAQSFLLNNVAFLISIVATTIVIVVSVFSMTRSLTLFSLHPVFMSVGTLLFLSQGIIAYRNNSLLVTLGPIMQHNQRTKVRTIHQTMQSIGGSFLFLGLMAILTNKIEYKHSIAPMSIHSVVGSLTLLMIVVQLVTGQQKLNQMSVSNSKIRRWHGDAGLLLWDGLCLALITGLLSFLNLSVSIVVVMCVFIVWLAVHTQITGLKQNSAFVNREDNIIDDTDGPNTIENDFVDQFVPSDPLLQGDKDLGGSASSPVVNLHSNFSSQSDISGAAELVRV